MQKILDLIAFELTKLDKNLKDTESVIRQAGSAQERCTEQKHRIMERIAEYKKIRNIVKHDMEEGEG